MSRIDAVVAKLERGENLALVSDAGTPLVSDPGGRLVPQLIERGVRVVPIRVHPRYWQPSVAQGSIRAPFFFLVFRPLRRVN